MSRNARAGRRQTVNQKRQRSVRQVISKNQSLNALAIGEQENLVRTKTRSTRLGQFVEEGNGTRSRSGEERPTKRQKIAFNHVSSDGEDENAGSDSDGNQWHFGVDNEGDDSDLDSDEAMGASDEERFEGFVFRGSAEKWSPRQTHSRTSENALKRASELDLSEDGPKTTDLEQVDYNDLGDDAVDLATALDMNEKERDGDSERQTHPSRRGVARREPSTDLDQDINASDEDDSTEAQEEGRNDTGSELSFSENEAAEDADNHARLRNFVQGLAVEGKESEQRKKNADYSFVPEQPSEYGLKSSTKLTAADLLPTITDTKLRQSLKILSNTEKSRATHYQGGVPGKLEPPLAKRQQDRLDRAAAYDKSKETLNRWIATVKQNRRAEHISFPLSGQDVDSLLGTKELTSLTHSGPLTSLESTIHSIMQESGLSSKDGQDLETQARAYEELQERKMPIEEFQARRLELRKARDLMFREELKARRIKKIKSKAYRRVHRKERDKATQAERATLAAAGLLNSDDERDQNDRRRAEERMGAKHRESRWAKGVRSIGSAAWDEDARSGVMELARRDEDLRRRIEGKAVAGSDGSEDVSASEIDDTNSDESPARKLEEELTMLIQHPVQQTGSKLGSMAFMKKAEESRRRANDADLRQLRRTLGVTDSESPDDEVQEGNGRRKYGLQKTVSAPSPHVSELREFDERLSDDDQNNEISLEDLDGIHIIAGQPQKTTNARPGVTSKRGTRNNGAGKHNASPSDNPWLSGSRKTKASDNGSQATVLLDPDASNLMDVVDAAQRSQSYQHQYQKATSHAADDSFTSSSETEEEEPNKQVKPAHISNRNEDLVRIAFAGDDVFDHFAKEKSDAVKDEGDQVVDNTLPGWGSWTGVGISKREQKRAKGRFVTTIKGVQADKRKDAKLERIIINEKRVKKNVKYLATELPHPFESRQQYERSLRLPLGPEWTTKTTFQDATKPRLLMKQGIVRPLETPIA